MRRGQPKTRLSKACGTAPCPEQSSHARGLHTGGCIIFCPPSLTSEILPLITGNLDCIVLILIKILDRPWSGVTAQSLVMIR